MASDTVRAPSLRKFWTLVFSMAVLAGAILTSPAQTQTAESEIIGTPEVIDADILKFGQQRVILWGIDAPERPQICHLNGAIWGCYDAAKRKMQLLAGRGEVICTLRGDPDPFGRRFGVCTSGGQDLNAEMVKAGFALAFEEQSDDYVPQMADAIIAGLGLWQVGVKFEEPWAFRRRENPSGYR
jgi:endonuclease YncB( thermonuclease family)